MATATARSDAGRKAETSTSLRITQIGGPTVLIEVGGWRLLTDPTFDPPGRRYSFGWGSSSRKTAGPAIAASELGPVDAVLLSHDHREDKLDAAGRELLSTVDTVLTTAAGASRLGRGARGLVPWATESLEAAGRTTIEVIRWAPVGEPFDLAL